MLSENTKYLLLRNSCDNPLVKVFYREIVYHILMEIFLVSHPKLWYNTNKHKYSYVKRRVGVRALSAR